MRKIILLLSFLVTGCSSVDLATVDTFGLCKEFDANKPLTGSNRVGLAVATFGLSEVGRAFSSEDEDISNIEKEMSKRGLTDCTPEGQAAFECKNIYGEADSKEYKACILTTSNSIAARIESEKAKRRANAAAAAAHSTTSPISSWPMPSY